MSFSNLIASASRKPVYYVEFDGDTVLSLDSASGWGATGADTTGIATTTTCLEGAAGIMFNKSGTTITSGGIVNNSIPAISLADSAYLALRCRLPAVSDIDYIEVNFGQDASNRYRWIFDSPGLSVGWNLMRLDRFTQGANVTLLTAGSPVPTGCDHMRVLVVLNAAANTLSGIIVDWVTKHPYRYATGKVKSARASTKAGWLELPSLGENLTRVQDGSISVGPASYNIVDKGGATLITDMARFFMPGRIATLYMGSRDEADSDDNFKAIHRGVIFAPQHIGRAFQFQASDLLEKLSRGFAQDATEANPFVISGPALRVMLQILLSTGQGTNNTTYDVLSSTEGIGFPASNVDVTAIETLLNTFGISDDQEFTFYEPEPSFIAWVQEEIFRPLGYSPSITPEGKLTVAMVLPPYGDDTTVDLDRTNVVTRMPQYTQTLDNLVNQIAYFFNYDIATDAYLSEPIIVENLESQARYGLRTLTIKSKGVKTTAVATRGAKRILSRLGNGSPPIVLEALGSQQQRYIGEVVRLTHPLLPDLENGAYGLTDALCAVDGRGYNPKTSKVALTLAHTSYQAGGYRRIAPAALPVYTSQTDAQKRRYLSWSGAAETFSNGDASHAWGPG